MYEPRKSLFACLTALGVLGCSGTETGNPGGQITLAISARTTDATRVSSSDGASELQVESARVSFRSIVLLSCSGEATAHWSDMAVELTDADAMQFRVNATSAEACGLRLEVAPPEEDAALGEYSVLVGGARSDGTPFEISSKLETTVTLSSDTSFEAEQLILAFDLSVWLDPDEVHGAVLHEDVAQISDQANPELLAAIDARFGLSAELFVDGDGDGHLDSDESEAVARAE